MPQGLRVKVDIWVEILGFGVKGSGFRGHTGFRVNVS
jgi:hypothetical protein